MEVQWVFSVPWRLHFMKATLVWNHCAEFDFVHTMSPNTATNIYRCTAEDIHPHWVYHGLVCQSQCTGMQEIAERGGHSPSLHWRHLTETLTQEGGTYRQGSPPSRAMPFFHCYVGQEVRKPPPVSGTAIFLQWSGSWTNLLNPNSTLTMEHYGSPLCPDVLFLYQYSFFSKSYI